MTPDRPSLKLGNHGPEQFKSWQETAAQQHKLLSEFEAALGRNQTTWRDQAKTVVQQSLNGALRAARDNTALFVEEAARNNAAAVCSATGGSPTAGYVLF